MVMVTGMDGPAVAKQALEIGVDDYITKGITFTIRILRERYETNQTLHQE